MMVGWGWFEQGRGFLDDVLGDVQVGSHVKRETVLFSKHDSTGWFLRIENRLYNLIC